MNKTIAVVFFSILMHVFAFSNANFSFQDEESYTDINRIVGYWEGEFMPGKDFTLILIFSDRDEIINGRIYLFQGDIQIQNDPLSEIILHSDSLSFLIGVKNTTFHGKLKMNDQQISGMFLFPDRSLHPATLKKINKPSKGDFEKIQLEASGSEILGKKYTVAQLKYDLNFLKKEMKSHPQLYLYTSKEELDKMFTEALSSITSEMTEDEFFRLIAPIIAKINCSHTGIRFSDNYNHALNQQAYLIPLDIQFFDDKAYVINSFNTDPDIEKGIQLSSVNRMTISEIKEKLMKAVPSDALNPDASLYDINSNFPFVYSLYIGNNEIYDVEFITHDGNTLTFELPAINMQEYDEAMMRAYPEDIPSGPIPVEIEIDKSKSIAILKVFAFWAPDPHLYIDFLKTNFKTLKDEKIKNLIIDVRGNQGGYPYYAAELLTYIIKTDFPYFELPLEKGDFEPLYDPLERKENAFTGNIFVLMDGGCLSTTGHFLSLVQFHNLATLIGEKSGATFYCNDNSKQLKFPNTGINLNLAQTTFQTAISGFKKGDKLLPDLIVKPDLQDILNKNDAVLIYTRELIEE